MKKFSVIMFLCVAVAIFAAVPSQSPHTVQAQDGTEISIWITGGENDATALSNAAQIFTEETGIVVKVEAVSWGDAYSRYLTAINSGTGADMFAGGMSWGISLGDLGGLVDLKATFGEEAVNAVLEVNNPEFVKAIIGVDGAVYGVPYNQDTILMFYLPENLEAVGYDAPPTTWDEYVEVVNALRDADLGGAGFGWGHGEWIGFQIFLAQAGGSWYTEDCSASAINTEEGLLALEQFTLLYDELGFPVEQVDTGAGFSTGELSITFDGEWVAPSIEPSYPELAGRWSVAPLPAGPSSNASFVGGKMIGVFSYSDHVEESWQFIQWLQTSEAAQAIIEETAGFGALFIPTQIENLQYISADDFVRDALIEQFSSTTAPPNCPGWEESNAAINLELQRVVFEGAPFEDALIAMEDILNDALVEYGN
ncbi:MAG: hypothetical protein CUN55_13575 [Phototrophicales bacterium]|nr:MAG: hypothetical protein CUN55_13575 [Phototrophicales bacterium]